jgi:hypothetical protein
VLVRAGRVQRHQLKRQGAFIFGMTLTQRRSPAQCNKQQIIHIGDIDAISVNISFAFFRRPDLPAPPLSTGSSQYLVDASAAGARSSASLGVMQVRPLVFACGALNMRQRLIEELWLFHGRSPAFLGVMRV